MTPDSGLVCGLLPSPNFGERRGRAAPDMIVLHYTGMEDGEAAARWLATARSEVSSHYLVHEDGRIVQLVEERMRAWHAGAGSWKGCGDVNSRSIGIEIVNPGHDHGYRPFPDAQIAAVIALCLDCTGRWPIPPEHVLAHSDVAPGRKQDPGELFPWDALFRGGLGHHVDPVPIGEGASFGFGEAGEAVATFQSGLAAYGYGVAPTGLFDEETRLATVAFQRHFRPARVDGIADASTCGTLSRLLAALTRPPSAGA